MSNSHTPTPSRFLAVMLLLFVGSGCAALIYEVVWLQMLQLYVGSSAVSIGVLLGTFMGGMCLGSLLLARVISPSHHPLRVYASLELGIGAIGLLLLVVLPLVGQIYTAWGGYGVFGFLLRGLVAAICLLPPTILMGATLPAVARWVETTPEGVSWLGFFYGGNIAGAVAGSLLAGFYLLRVYDMTIATFAAAGFNVLVAGVGLIVAAWSPYQAAEIVPAGAPERAAEGSRAVYLVIALSGLTALASEVIWTRMLGLLFGASVYTFSIILAVFLVGLGIGSSVGSLLAKTLDNPRIALGWCQMLIAASITWTGYIVSASLPYWPINPSITTSIWYNFQLDIVRAFFAILPGTLLWGASFPLALAAVARKGEDPGRLVGGVYAANTVGAIAGALLASLLLISWLGSQRAQQVLIAVAACAGVIALTPKAVGEEAKAQLRQDSAGQAPMRPLGAIGVMAATGLIAFFMVNVPPIPNLLVAYGRYSATRVGSADIFYMGEGLNSSLAVSRLSNGVLNYHNAGKIQASSEPQDMRLQRMLGHLTTLVPRRTDTVLVIGCGAGVTAGAVSIDPALKRELIVEIEPLVPQVVSDFFGEHNFNVIRNPKVEVRYDDARHYLLTADETFDAITSDPFDPWVKGAATLYTKEFFEVVKAHLNPGGVVTVFVQLYESNLEAVKSEVATFMEVFPNGLIFGNTQEGQGYDMVLVGQAQPEPIDVDAIEARLRRPEYAPVRQSLAEIGIHSAIDLFANYAGRGPDLAAWTRDAQINRDRNLKLQYLAGLGLNLYESASIYSDLLQHSRFPEGVFSGSTATLQALREGIQRMQGRW